MGFIVNLNLTLYLILSRLPLVGERYDNSVITTIISFKWSCYIILFVNQIPPFILVIIILFLF